MATIVKAKAPTQKEQFAKMIAVFKEIGGHDDLIQFCNERIEKLAKKATSANSKKSAEDEKFFDLIADVLADGKGMRASEIHKVLAVDNATLTVQKVTAMLKKMVDCGRAVKTVDKKVATFSLAFGVEDTESEDAE